MNSPSRSAGSDTSSLSGVPSRLIASGVRLAVAPERPGRGRRRSRPRHRRRRRTAPTARAEGVGRVGVARPPRRARTPRAGRANGRASPSRSHTRSRPSSKNSSIALHAVELAPQRRRPRRARRRCRRTRSSATTVQRGAAACRRSRAAVTTASVPSLPHSRPAEVEAGVVLLETVEPADHTTVGQHRLDADELAARRSVAQHVHTARVGRDRPADRRDVARAEIDAVLPTRRGARASAVAPASRRPAR